VNHVDKRFGERDRLIRFGDAQVRSSKVGKNRYVRRISFERPALRGGRPEADDAVAVQVVKPPVV